MLDEPADRQVAYTVFEIQAVDVGSSDMHCLSGGVSRLVSVDGHQARCYSRE